MAIAQSDGSIVLTTKVDQDGLKKGMSSFSVSAKKMASTAGKAFLAIGAAATAATVAIVKSSVDAFAEYEQLVGGVETLFRGSSKKLIEYANQAYKTAGMSANEYMKNVTAFSASLLSSLGGDTDKAADVANDAIISISDNVNKMGSDYQSVQLAFQGFAKQQYQLLDNLKLGYGGTKTEMERLLKDAEAYRASMGDTVQYEIDNLADVYTAIGDIQEKLGIAGTTAKEAEKTISGSAATMKAAWQNVLAAISGGGDLDRAINNLVDSISNYFENIVPVVERALSGIGKLIEKVAPKLVQTVAKSLIAAIPSLLNAVYEMIIGLAKGIYQGIVDLFNETTVDALEKQSDSIAENEKSQKQFTNAVKETRKEADKASASFDEIQTISVGQNGDISDMVEANTPSQQNITEIFETGKTEKELSSFEKYLKKIFSRIKKMIAPLMESFSDLWDSIKPNKQDIKSSFDWIENEIFSPFVSYVLTDFLPNGVKSIEDAFLFLNNVIQTIKQPLSDFWNETLKPIFQNIGEWAKKSLDETSNSFSYFSEKLSENQANIQNVLNAIHNVIKIVWALIKPIFGSIIDSIGGVLKTTIDFIFSAISVLSNWISFFENIGKAIVSIFKGNWSEAETYFKNALINFTNFYVGIANAIISVINNLWNLVFNSFRGAINSVGGLIEKFGDFLGKDWDLSWNATAPLIPLIPQSVPKLAKGAVIPANKEFLAVLGDQKRGTNVEAPLSTIQEAVAVVMEDVVQSNVAGNEAVVSVLETILEAIRLIDTSDEKYANAVDSYQRKMAIVRGV